MRWPDGTEAIVEGVSLVLRVAERQLRIVPIEAVEAVSDSERELTIGPSIAPHSLARHSSLRRLDGRWRVDVTLDVPLMDADYWLAHCEGFLVDAPSKEVGIVEDVLFDAPGDPEMLLVRTGGLRGRTVALAPADVVEVIPGWKVIGIERDLEVSAEEPSPASSTLTGLARRLGLSS